MARNIMWQKPRLRTDEDEDKERKVTWVELFYDLVFVVVIAELAHTLSSHITLNAVIGFILIFIPVWWIWIGGTFYSERFQTDDISFRIITLLQMIPVLVLAVFIHDGLGDTSAQFALTYAAARIIITSLWIRGGLHNPSFRPFSNRYSVGFITSIILFILSVFVAPPLRFLFWAVGLFLDLVTPLTTIKMLEKLPKYSSHRLPERFGLFVIIVLGESIVGIVNGVSDSHEVSYSILTVASVGIVLIFLLWWIYFDTIARRIPKATRMAPWSYLHLPLVMSVVAIGASIPHLLTDLDILVSGEVRLLLAGALGSALIIIAILEYTLTPVDYLTDNNRFISSGLKLITGIGAFAVGFLGVGLGSLELLTILILMLLVHIVYGAFVWRRYLNRMNPEPVEHVDEGSS